MISQSIVSGRVLIETILLFILSAIFFIISIVVGRKFPQRFNTSWRIESKGFYFEQPYVNIPMSFGLAMYVMSFFADNANEIQKLMFSFSEMIRPVIAVTVIEALLLFSIDLSYLQHSYWFNFILTLITGTAVFSWAYALFVKSPGKMLDE